MAGKLAMWACVAGGMLTLVGCGKEEPPLIKTYPNPSGTVTLIDSTYGGGGAAGWLWTEMTLKFPDLEKPIPVLNTRHPGGYTVIWTDDSHLVMCIDPEYDMENRTVYLLQQLDVITRQGPVTIHVELKCAPEPPQPAPASAE